MKHKERVEFVRDIPVEKQHPVGGHWHDWAFVQDCPYEISNRQEFIPPNGADPRLIDPRYQFELWDDEGFIGAYRIKTKVWDESVRMLEIKETA
jgi:hypothetical protein